MLSPKKFIVNSPALSTNPKWAVAFARIPVVASFNVWVAFSAFLTFAFSFCCGLSCMLRLTFSAPNVFLMSNWLQVVWIHATANSAQVVKFQAFRNWSTQCLKHLAVCRSWNIMSPVWHPYSDSSIPVSVQSCSPKPASRIGLWDTVVHQSFDNGFSHAISLVGCIGQALCDVTSVALGRSYFTAYRGAHA